jgi:hypothetical protein
MNQYRNAIGGDHSDCHSTLGSYEGVARGPGREFLGKVGVELRIAVDPVHLVAMYLTQPQETAR